MARQVASRTGEPTGAAASAATSAAQPAVRGQRGGQLVVGEQGRLAGHRGQPPRGVGDRVEQGERRGGRARSAGPARPPVGSGRQREHRQQHPHRGQPRPGPVLRHAVHVDQQLVHPGRAQRQAGVRVAAQQHGQPHRQLPPGRQLAGQRHELRLHRVGAGVAVQRVPELALGAQRRPRCTRISSSSDRYPAGVGEHADHGQRLRPVRGDQPRFELGEPQRQRAGVRRPAAGPGRPRPAGERRGERQRRQQQHDDRDKGRDRSSRGLLQQLGGPPDQPALVGVGQPGLQLGQRHPGHLGHLDVLVGQLAAQRGAAGSGARSCARGGPRRRTRSRWCPAVRPPGR